MTAAASSRSGPMDMVRLLEALQSGAATPAELTDRAISHLAAVNHTLNCVALKTFERARQSALTPSSGPLSGIPTMIKDNLAEAGLPLSWGSAALQHWIASEDGPYVRAIKAAGLTSIARSTMPELGMNVATESPLAGVTRNPWNPDYAPGGSSGGAAAAVASGAVPIAQASDGLGSIRHGAGPCGLVGLKPSKGRNIGEESKRALTDISVNGCLSRTVRDTAEWFSATQSREPHAAFAPVDSLATPLTRRLRIQVYDTVMRTGVAPDESVSRVLENTIDHLEAFGHSVGKGILPFNGPDAAEALGIFIEGRFSREFDVLRTQLGDVVRPEALEHRSKTLVAAGQQVDDEMFARALQRIESNAASYLEAFADHDIWMTPTFSTEIIRVGAFAADMDWREQKYPLVDYAGYCWIDNFAGSPAISLPMGFSDAGLPVGIQFATQPGGEALLLALALQLESVGEWWRATPPIWVGDDWLDSSRISPPPQPHSNKATQSREHGHAS